MKTKDRIVHVALELFNEFGERKITTNHIAAHLKISPGNLYYHYRNKSDIIARIFDQYEVMVESLFDLPQDREITLDDRAELTQKLLDLLWQYRFMHRDLVGMLENDQALHQRYQAFANHAIDQITMLYRRMCESGFMQMQPDEIQPLALNAWLLCTGWANYLRTAQGITEEEITKAHLNQVIYQLTYMEMRYLTEVTRAETSQILAQFKPL